MLVIGIILAILLSGIACIRQSRQEFVAARDALIEPESENPSRINLNSASAKQLEALPGIGKALAERIVEHRSKYGPFRRPEHLMMVRGISENKFRELRDLISTE